jgi:hypothetical protein
MRYQARLWIFGITNINERSLSIRLGYDYLPGTNTVVNETKNIRFCFFETNMVV